jgi:hypothetical protein
MIQEKKILMDMYIHIHSSLLVVLSKILLEEILFMI